METAEETRLAGLYQRDETAWLEAMSDLIRLGRLDEVDFANLAEYLADTARRDRREVISRLSIADRPPPETGPPARGRRSGSWLATVELQRQEFSELLESRDVSEPRRRGS